MTKKYANPKTAGTGAPDKCNFRRIPAGLLTEWLIVLVACVAILLLSVVVR